MNILQGDLALSIQKCTDCGLCCSNKHDQKWIEVTNDDLKKLPEGSVVEGDIKKHAMKQDKNGKCMYLEGSLGVKCRCQIYENRPQICKDVLMGSPICVLSIQRELQK